MMVPRNDWERGGGPCRPRMRFVLRSFGLVLFGCALTLALSETRAAEKRLAWDQVESGIREDVRTITESVSDIVGVLPHQLNYQRDGSETLPYLDSRPYDQLFRTYFLLRGIGSDGKPIPPEASTSRSDEYGQTLFTVGFRKLMGLPPEQAVAEMREGRRLAEAVHSLGMQSFWMMYNLVETADELKAQVDAIRDQGRRSKDLQVRKAFVARARAQQQANQKKVQAAVAQVEKQAEKLRGARAAAMKRQKEWQTAQDLRILDARESRLGLEVEARRRAYEDSVRRLSENAEMNPQLEEALPARLARLQESFHRFEARTQQKLEEIQKRRAILAGKPIAAKPTAAEGRVHDARAAEHLRRSRRRKVGTLRSARFKLGTHPGPSTLTSKAFSMSTGEGLMLELDSLARRPRRSAQYFWPCGRYLVSVEMNIQSPILKHANRYDGEHRRVPFLERRLEQAEAVRDAVQQGLDRTGLCEASDGYWPWTKRYTAKAEENKSRIEEIKVQLDTLAKEKEQKREDWLELMLASLERGLPGDGTTVLGQRAVKSHKELRDRLRAEIRQRHAEQRELIAKAEERLEAQRDLLEQQFEKSKKTRPHVERRYRAFELEMDMIRLELYDVARWYEPNELPAVLRDFERRLADLGVGERDARWQFKEWMRAKWLLARADKLDERIRLQRPVHGRLSGSAGTWYKTGRLLERPSRLVSGDEAKELGNPLALAARTARQDAISKLRSLLEQDPKNLAVGETLRFQEKQWLRRIAGKLEVERRTSLESFNRYLANRGYDPNDTGGWWEGFKDYLGYAWGAGPITSLTAIPGAPLPFGLARVFPEVRLPGTSIPGSQAEATDRALTRNAKHQMALFAIMRLHDNGVPLGGIPGLAAEAKKLAEAMVLKDSRGEPMPTEKAAQLGKDIRQTFVELDDLRALTLGKMDRFNKALAASHYSTIDVEQSWSEFLGDALSPRHLLTTLGPSAVTRAGGKWVWTAKPTAYRRITEGGTSVMRARDSLVATLRLEKVGKWFAGKAPGRWLANKVIVDQQHVADLKGWNVLVNSGSRLLAAMVIAGGGVHLAEQHGGAAGRLLAEALAELGTQEVAYDILSRSGTPLRKLAGEVDEFGLLLVKKRARLDDLRHVLGELNALSKDGSKLETRALEKAAKRANDGTGTAVTQVAVPETVEHGLNHAIGGVVQALRKGELAEAREALGAAQDFAERLGKDLLGLDAKVEAARGLLTRVRTKARRLVGKNTPSGKLKSLGDQGIPTAFFAEGRLYDLPVSGKFLDDADDAFQRGDLAGAIRNYRRARRWAKRHDQAEMVGFVDDRLALAAGTQNAAGILARLRSRTRTIEAAEGITDGEIRELIEQFQKGVPLSPIKGGTSPVFEFRDRSGDRYVFKQLGDSEEMATEAAASGLAKALGIKAPAARRVRMGKVKALVEENGKKVVREIEAEGVLYRHIEGESLSNLTEPVAGALKREYAKQRVLRAWLADPDVHFGNHLLGGDAHLWALDFGKANLKRKQLVKVLKDGDRYAEYRNLSPEKYMDFVMNIPHLEAYRKKLPQYAWMARIDEMVHYEDMADTVEAVKKLVQGDGRELRAILEESLPKSQVDEAFEVLRERAAHLEAAMLKRFSRPSARLTKRAGKAVRPWMVREGEGRLPHTAAEARPGKPMVLDPEVSRTYLYVVKDDGGIVYAPQKYELWIENNRTYRREAVKHTDLAEAGPAKIGGEIRYKDGIWYMDGQSGRYSAAKDPVTGRVYATRTKEELEAAVELARRSGTQQTIEAKFRGP